MSQKMIPLHIADQAVAAVEADLAKVKAERDQLKADLEKSDGVVWTLSVENARLKAECQARQAENSVLAVECDSLKAEVERLTKAGDAMADELIREYGREVCLKFGWFNGWIAAKGVQS